MFAGDENLLSHSPSESAASSEGDPNGSARSHIPSSDSSPVHSDAAEGSSLELPVPVRVVRTKLLWGPEEFVRDWSRIEMKIGITVL